MRIGLVVKTGRNTWERNVYGRREVRVFLLPDMDQFEAVGRLLVHVARSMVLGVVVPLALVSAGAVIAACFCGG